jgi:hypothetical protein
MFSLISKAQVTWDTYRKESCRINSFRKKILLFLKIHSLSLSRANKKQNPTTVTKFEINQKP